jgi:TolB-like protein/tetratricopeptide (TPR) repeat protein
MRIQPGTTLGRYQIVSLLGSGGMGEVYRARDERLGRDVAIKVLNAAPDSDRLTRFEREARATALLAHPNILTIFDVGSHDGAPFIVCELLEGQTLRGRLASGPIKPGEAIGIALQLARGVAAAHAVRVVHRDIKPENLFITHDGTLKILDFGLAKLKTEALLANDAETVDVSSPGLLIGTPGYMAPEQVRGAVVDERTDIFAIGTVLHEMLTAIQLFRRPSSAETIAAVLNDRPRAMGSGIPVALERIVFRCLEKDPADRFQSASELAVVLETARGATPAPGESPATAATGGEKSIAVLPFLDMSPGRDHDYLCDGIAEELIGSLTHVAGLRVAARSTSFQFRDSMADARAGGARLGVDSVLEGGVRKIGDRLRVTVQLVDVADGYQRWSQRFDGGMDDIFDMQDKIAESVATALRGMLSSSQKDALRRPGTEVEAYEHFLRGRRVLYEITQSSAGEAASFFRQAIEIDPLYAPAHAGLAQVYGWEYEWWGGEDRAFESADNASRRALELAPGLSEAHTARGFVLALRGRYEEASREFDEALRLNPNSFEALYLYARACFAWGRIERSAELFGRGGEVQPEDFQCPILRAQSLGMLGRVKEAEEVNREGIRRAERRLELAPRDPRALSLGASALMDAGERDRALEWSARAAALAPEDPAVLINAACTYAKNGDKEKALDYLEQSFAKGFGKRDWVENDPDYEILRDDPRFQAMLEKLK